MFSLAQPAFCPSYNPYEQLLLQQELQRRRQVEAYLRQQREAEEIERRRAYERALLQAEYERRLAAEYECRRRAEVERLRRQAEAERRHPMFDGGMQDLFDALYGRARSASPDREPARGEQNATVNEKPSSQTPSTPTSPIVSEPAPSEAEPENEQVEEETPQIDTAPSLAAVQSILSSFSTVRSDFTFPTHLDFVPSSSKLAYTPNNAPLHGYEHALTGLLTQLDAVESFGDDKVRKARKEAVKAIELELEKLDSMRTAAWKQQFEAETEPAVMPEPEVMSFETTVTLPEPESAMDIDPIAVPLPQDLDEDMSGDVSKAGMDPDATSPESPCVTPTQSPVSVDLPPLSGSPEPLSRSRSLSSPSPSDSSDTESEVDLEDFVEVEDVMSASETEAEEEAVEKDGDLELMRDWDLDF